MNRTPLGVVLAHVEEVAVDAGDGAGGQPLADRVGELRAVHRRAGGEDGVQGDPGGRRAADDVHHLAPGLHEPLVADARGDLGDHRRAGRRQGLHGTGAGGAAAARTAAAASPVGMARRLIAGTLSRSARGAKEPWATGLRDWRSDRRARPGESGRRGNRGGRDPGGPPGACPGGAGAGGGRRGRGRHGGRRTPGAGGAPGPAVRGPAHRSRGPPRGLEHRRARELPLPDAGHERARDLQRAPAGAAGGGGARRPSRARASRCASSPTAGAPTAPPSSPTRWATPARRCCSWPTRARRSPTRSCAPSSSRTSPTSCARRSPACAGCSRRSATPRWTRAPDATSWRAPRGRPSGWRR